MKNKNLWIYRISTGMLTVFMLLSAGMYLFMHDFAVEMWEALGVPTFIIYPLAAAKILGLLAIWSNKSKMLKEWAYAGFVFNFLLAIGVHLNVADGEFGGALMALILVVTSRIYWGKLEAAK